MHRNAFQNFSPPPRTDRPCQQLTAVLNAAAAQGCIRRAELHRFLQGHPPHLRRDRPGFAQRQQHPFDLALGQVLQDLRGSIHTKGQQQC